MTSISISISMSASASTSTSKETHTSTSTSASGASSASGSASAGGSASETSARAGKLSDGLCQVVQFAPVVTFDGDGAKASRVRLQCALSPALPRDECDARARVAEQIQGKIQLKPGYKHGTSQFFVRAPPGLDAPH